MCPALLIEVVHSAVDGLVGSEVLGGEVLPGQRVGAVVFEPPLDVRSLVGLAQDSGHRVRE